MQFYKAVKKANNQALKKCCFSVKESFEIHDLRWYISVINISSSPNFFSELIDYIFYMKSLLTAVNIRAEWYETALKATVCFWTMNITKT